MASKDRNRVVDQNKEIKFVRNDDIDQIKNEKELKISSDDGSQILDAEEMVAVDSGIDDSPDEKQQQLDDEAVQDDENKVQESEFHHQTWLGKRTCNDRTNIEESDLVKL